MKGGAAKFLPRISVPTAIASARKAKGVPMLRAGATIAEVAVATGASPGTVKGWARQGGRGYRPEVKPPEEPPPPLVCRFADDSDDDTPLGGR